MIPPVRQAAILFAVVLLFSVAGCQQQADNAPANDSAANNPNESTNLHEITLAVTGMT